MSLIRNFAIFAFSTPRMKIKGISTNIKPLTNRYYINTHKRIHIIPTNQRTVVLCWVVTSFKLFSHQRRYKDTNTIDIVKL
jgi:hypothetical protein